MQLPAERAVPADPALWKCQETGATDNLWLNLSTGLIGSGRQVSPPAGGTHADLRYALSPAQPTSPSRDTAAHLRCAPTPRMPDCKPGSFPPQSFSVDFSASLPAVRRISALNML